MRGLTLSNDAALVCETFCKFAEGNREESLASPYERSERSSSTPEACRRPCLVRVRKFAHASQMHQLMHLIEPSATAGGVSLITSRARLTDGTETLSSEAASACVVDGSIDLSARTPCGNVANFAATIALCDSLRCLRCRLRETTKEGSAASVPVYSRVIHEMPSSAQGQGGVNPDGGKRESIRRRVHERSFTTFRPDASYRTP